MVRFEADFSVCADKRTNASAWNSLMAACAVASDFAGVIAAARYHGERATGDDDDNASRITGAASRKLPVSCFASGGSSIATSANVCAESAMASSCASSRPPCRRAHRVVTPWAVSRRDGKLVEIDERGVVRRIITRPARI
jgi:hypothetical protein